MYKIQCTGAWHHVPELLCEPNTLVLPNAAPSLAKIMAAHEAGKPIDASLMRDAPYNDIEHNPFHEKGLDLADLPRIAKEIGSTKEAIEADIQALKRAKNQTKTPDQSQAPEQVSTE